MQNARAESLGAHT